MKGSRKNGREIGPDELRRWARAVWIELYGIPVFLFTDRKQYNATATLMGEENEIGMGAGGVVQTFYGLTTGQTVILMGWFNKDVGTLAHECFHATQRLMKLVGVKFDHDNDEPYAYAIGSMVRFFRDAVK